MLGSVVSFCAYALLRWENGHDFRVGRGVWVVAINTVIARPGTTTEIPESVHASVAAVVVVTELRAMALGAELHDV